MLSGFTSYLQLSQILLKQDYQIRMAFSRCGLKGGYVSAMYAFLLLASIKAYKKNGDSKNRKFLLPRPKWYPAKKEQRFTSGDLINQLRTELWAKALGFGSFYSFVSNQHQTQSLRNETNPLSSAILYTRK